jgi:NitT/TauT family transport system ATP-binding protein
LLLDEPFSALDIKTAENLRTDLLHIWQELHITIVMVSHSVEEAVEMAEIIYILKNGRLEEGLAIDLSYPRHQSSTEYLEKVLRVKRLL